MRKSILIISCLTFCVQLFSQNYFELPVRNVELSNHVIKYNCTQNTFQNSCVSNFNCNGYFPNSKTYIEDTNADGDTTFLDCTDQGIYSDFYNEYNNFNNNPCDNTCFNHSGIDLYGAEGTPVLACGDGYVELKNFNNGALGNFIVLKHEIIVSGGTQEIYSKYSHLQTVATLPLGSIVTKGQQIGTVGQTGENNLGVHLHLEFSSTLQTCGSTPGISCGYYPSPSANNYLNPHLYIKNSFSDLDYMEYNPIGCSFPNITAPGEVREFEPNNLMFASGNSISIDYSLSNTTDEINFQTMRIQNIALNPTPTTVGDLLYAKVYANFTTPYDSDMFSINGQHPGVYVFQLNNLNNDVDVKIYKRIDSNNATLIAQNEFNTSSDALGAFCEPGATYYIEIRALYGVTECQPYNLSIYQLPDSYCSLVTNTTSPFTNNDNEQNKLNEKNIIQNKAINNPEIEIAHNQACFTNSYDVNVDIVSASTYSIIADVYENGVLINSVTNLNENTNYPINVASNIALTSNVTIHYTGHSDNQCTIDVQENIYGASCPSTPVCEIPYDLTANTTGSVTSFSWANVSTANSYTIQYSSDGYNHNLGGGTISSNSTTNPFASCNTYYFRVRSNCANGSSSFSNFVSFYIGSGSNSSCPSPNLSASQNGAYLQTNWINVNGETEYQLQTRELGGQWSSVFPPLNSNSNLYPIQGCTTYETRIRSICSCISSTWSSIQTVTTSGCSSVPTCNDGLQNQNETGIDCGGPCPACPSVSCNNLQITWPHPNDCGQQIALVSSTKNIIWSPYNCGSGLVNIEYSLDSGNSWITESTNEIDDGTYTIIFTSNHLSTNFRIRISCSTGSICGETCDHTVFGGTVFGCTNSNAHNYNANATYDNSSCETCFDGVINGTETGVDCGGSNPLCNPCNSANNVELTGPCPSMIYGWNDDITITWNTGTNSCDRVYFETSDDGGVTWVPRFNVANGISNDGSAVLTPINYDLLGEIMIRIECTNDASNYSVLPCTVTVTSCGGSIPPNDEPCGAISLPVGSTSCNYQTFSTCDFMSSNVPNPGCEAYTFGDIWFELIVPSSGKINVQSDNLTSTRPKFALYAGSCSNLSIVGCNGFDTADYSEQQYEYLSPGTIVYLRWWSANFNFQSIGDFNLCAFEPQFCSGENIIYPQDITIDCLVDATNLAITGDVLGETYICSTCVQASYTDNPNYSECGGGTIIRQWSFTDECNIIYNHNQVITILANNIPPNFDEPNDIALPCNANIFDFNIVGQWSNISIICNTASGGYYDNTDGLDFCTNTGLVLRFWFYEDDCGNRTTKIQNIFLYNDGCESTRCEGENCSNAIPIYDSGTYYVDPLDFGFGASQADATHAEWFEFIIPTSGELNINTCNQGVDTRMRIHHDSCNSPLIVSDNACEMYPGGNSWASEILNYGVYCGETIYIEFDNKWSSDPFNFDLNFVPFTTYFLDNDNDGFGNPNSQLLSCTPPNGYVTNDLDCNDTDSNTNPLALESCDGIDNNCDNRIDEILVTNTNDSGIGSFRYAITCANSNAGPDTIRFNIMGNSPHTIFPVTQMPTIQDDYTIIDGTSQPGYSPGDIVVDGISSSGTIGLDSYESNNLEIYGLKIQNYSLAGYRLLSGDSIKIGAQSKGNIFVNNGDGVILRNGTSVELISNFIGVMEDATTPSGNTLSGVRAYGNSDCTIRSNIIGSNLGAGIYFGIGNSNFQETDYSIKFNYIGTNWNGVNLGNGSSGIKYIYGISDKIDLFYNYLAFNNGYGIFMTEPSVTLWDPWNNSYWCNSNGGIYMIQGSNANLQTPTVINASTYIIEGTSEPFAWIELRYASNDCISMPCQGETIIATTYSDANGVWKKLGTFINGEMILVNQGVESGGDWSTSDFSTCQIVENCVTQTLVINKIIDSDTTIYARDQIELDNVTIIAPFELTLRTQEVIISNNCEVEQGANLTVIYEDDCIQN